MPTYKYEAMDTTGGEVKDSIDAANEEEAQQKIRQKGYFVTRLTEVAGKTKDKKKAKAAPKATTAKTRSSRRTQGSMTRLFMPPDTAHKLDSN